MSVPIGDGVLLLRVLNILEPDVDSGKEEALGAEFLLILRSLFPIYIFDFHFSQHNIGLGTFD